MNDDLKKFENRSDDWLADQIKYESLVSAWDLDEGRRLKEEHEILHSAYNEKIEEIRELNKVKDISFKPQVFDLNKTSIENIDEKMKKNLGFVVIIGIIVALIIAFGIIGYGENIFGLIMMLIFITSFYTSSKKQRRK